MIVKVTQGYCSGLLSSNVEQYGVKFQRVAVSLRLAVRRTERERETVRERHTERDTERHRERDTERETHREGETLRERERH